MHLLAKSLSPSCNLSSFTASSPVTTVNLESHCSGHPKIIKPSFNHNRINTLHTGSTVEHVEVDEVELDVWMKMQEEAKLDVIVEPILSNYYNTSTLSHKSLQTALAIHLAIKHGNTRLPRIKNPNAYISKTFVPLRVVTKSELNNLSRTTQELEGKRGCLGGTGKRTTVQGNSHFEMGVFSVGVFQEVKDVKCEVQNINSHFI